METVQICQPCFELVQKFGITDWIIFGILFITAIIFTFTQKNFFSLGKGIIAVIQSMSDAKKSKEETK